MAQPPESAHEVSTRLRATGYLPDEGLSTITYLALAMQRQRSLHGQGEVGDRGQTLVRQIAGRPQPRRDLVCRLGWLRHEPTLGDRRLSPEVLARPAFLAPADARVRGGETAWERSSRRAVRAPDGRIPAAQ